MANGDFTQQFQICVERDGSEYVAARDAILADGAGVRPQLVPKLDSADWREQLAAQILIGWIDQRPLFERVETIVSGRPTGPRVVMPITGMAPAVQRARTLARQGAAVVPRLLEMLLKTGEYLATETLQAITQALELLNDERAVLPLADLVGRPANNQARVFALNVLGVMHDPRAFDAVQTAFARQENEPIVRGAAAVALGLLADRRAT